MKQKNLIDRDALFDPNAVFAGNPESILKDYPKRSRGLQRYCEFGSEVKNLNTKFIKDGKMYLLRGGKSGQETGFYSRLYKEKGTIESEMLDPSQVAYAQHLNGNTPFISATTDIYVAASFSLKERIYVLAIPVEDVYDFQVDKMLGESEYMIPDFISPDEIIRSFRYDKSKQIYNFLVNEIGLSLTPEDLGLIGGSLMINQNILEIKMNFNNSESIFDPFLEAMQERYLKMKLNPVVVEKVKQGESHPKRQIALFTDVHALLEPTEAVLADIKSKGIEEVYSLGDNIGLGPNPREVIGLLDEYGVVSVAGNYEEMLRLGNHPFMAYLTREKIEDIEWTKSQLSREEREHIKKYCSFINLRLAGQDIGLCHFANDIRCDFKEHSVWDYMDSVKRQNPNFRQFHYTNSKNQILEFAYVLGMDIELLKDVEDIQIGWKIIREYVRQNKETLESNPSIRGYLSFLNDQLFVKDGVILSPEDYSTIIQGHTHFYTKATSDNTDYYSLRGIGIGYSENSKDRASYAILREIEDEIDIETVYVPFDREKMEYSIEHMAKPNDLIRKYTITPKKR